MIKVDFQDSFGHLLSLEIPTRAHLVALNQLRETAMKVHRRCLAYRVYWILARQMIVLGRTEDRIQGNLVLM